MTTQVAEYRQNVDGRLLLLLLLREVVEFPLLGHCLLLSNICASVHKLWQIAISSWDYRRLVTEMQPLSSHGALGLGEAALIKCINMFSAEVLKIKSRLRRWRHPSKSDPKNGMAAEFSVIYMGGNQKQTLLQVDYCSMQFLENRICVR